MKKLFREFLKRCRQKAIDRYIKRMNHVINVKYLLDQKEKALKGYAMHHKSRDTARLNYCLGQIDMAKGILNEKN